MKGDHFAAVKEIKKSGTAKLKTFPIDDISRVMKRLENRANDSKSVRGRDTFFFQRFGRIVAILNGHILYYYYFFFFFQHIICSIQFM